jgi:monooxygenase
MTPGTSASASSPTAIRAGTAAIVTDEITSFTETGIELASGAHLDADIIVTATGLELLIFGGIELSVDGQTVDVPSVMAYKGMMLEGVPNLAFALGYTNASWTLKADLTGRYVSRLLAHMERRGHVQCAPHNADPTVEQRPLLDFDAGYVVRALAEMPKAGSKAPWRVYMNYIADLAAISLGRVDDGVMRFTGRAADA